MPNLIKCLIWDLDNTLWTGTLLEQDSCHLRRGIRAILRQLDRRGILLSIASANDRELAESFLEEKGIRHYFLHPQIGWANKVSSIVTIARALGIGTDSVGFVDDEPYELEQVRQILPSVRTYHAKDYRNFLGSPELDPRFLTAESRQRSRMYAQELARTQKQEESGKSHRDFLRSCGTEMTIRQARRGDLPRILELMHRTHQLNATGKIYAADQVRSFLVHPRYQVYVAELRDTFVQYGKIGVAVCRCYSKKWVLLSFLLSCRVLGRGIGSTFLAWLQSQAYNEGVSRLDGQFVKRERNQRMYLLFTLSGFRPRVARGNGRLIFSRECKGSVRVPEWLTLKEGRVT